MSGNPNPRSFLFMDPRPLALTLTLILLHNISPSSLASPSPSPSPSPSMESPSYPPKQSMSTPALLRPSPPGNFLRLPPPRPTASCNTGDPECRRVENPKGTPGAVRRPERHERKLNFGELMGLVFAGIAIALQVALGGFLIYRRRHLKRAERRDR